jgi:hypothetical protein
MIDKKHYEQMVKDSTPGKMEGNSADVAYYYEMMLDGDGEIIGMDSEIYTIFEISEEERNIFELGLKSDFPYYCIWETETGFVYGQAITEKEYKHLLYDAEQE